MATRELTVNLATVGMQVVKGARVEAHPVLTVGDARATAFLTDGQALLPSGAGALTDAQGIARLDIVPNTELPSGWRYRVSISARGFNLVRTVTMPDNDTDFVDLVDQADAPIVPATRVGGAGVDCQRGGAGDPGPMAPAG